MSKHGNANHNLSHACAASQVEQPDLRDLWGTLDTESWPIFRVICEDGVNVASAQIRPIGGGRWLYVDDVDGYAMLDSDEVEHLILVPDKEHRPSGWSRDGHVIDL